MIKERHIHYGCGLKAPPEWLNFDASPTLRIQKNPLLYPLFKKHLNVKFPDNVLYGDIIKGLPVENNSSMGIFCSHILEHLSLVDCRKAIANTYNMLMPGGIFRCIVPDLESAAKKYLKELDEGNDTASLRFIGSATLLGKEYRDKGAKSILTGIFGNSRHLWMWDKFSLAHELRNAGFTAIRECKFNDSKDPMFQLVEDERRFMCSVALESRK